MNFFEYISNSIYSCCQVFLSDLQYYDQFDSESEYIIPNTLKNKRKSHIIKKQPRYIDTIPELDDFIIVG